MCPMAAPRACVVPRCPGRVSLPGVSRCPEHQAAYRKAFDAGRPSARRRGYDRDWEKLRATFLAAHPRCERCGAPATDVDHMTAISAGGARLEVANLRSFCHSCHSSRTGRDQGGFAKRRQ